MAGLIDIIVPKINAQASGFVQPTFGSLALTGTTSSPAEVNISADKATVESGESVTVTVAIDTNNQPIREYRLAIGYDPNVFSVQDADTSTNGIQSTILDNTFVIENVERDNTVNVDTAEVLISASSETNTATDFENTDIVSITFQANQPGSSSIRVEDTTALVIDSGVERDFNTSAVSVTVQEAQVVVPEPEPQPPAEVINYACNPQTGECEENTNGAFTDIDQCNLNCDVIVTEPEPEIIPDTAITDNLGILIPIFFAVLLILFGASLRLGRKRS